jgi:hypothetical protein
MSNQETVDAVRLMVIGACLCDYGSRLIVDDTKQEMKMRCNGVINAVKAFERYFVGHPNGNKESAIDFKKGFNRNETVLLADLRRRLGRNSQCCKGINNTTMKKLKVLVACEESQTVTKAFRAKGYEAYSCDLLDCSGGHPEWHIKYDAKQVLRGGSFTLGNDWKCDEVIIYKWDLVIAHPPCTRLTNAGARWLTSKKPRNGYVWSEKANIFIRDDQDIWAELGNGITFFQEFKTYGMEGNKIAIENPKPHKYAREGFWVPDPLPEVYTSDFFFTGIGSFTQSIQPYEFGHMETKETCLWLYGLPELQPTNNVYYEMMNLPYGERAKVHHASPGPERAKIRSKTYTGIAEAMASQWS